MKNKEQHSQEISKKISVLSREVLFYTGVRGEILMTM